MTAIHVNQGQLPSCRDKVVVITGGANGIGASIVERFYHSGAHVHFSDCDEQSGQALERKLQSQTSSHHGTYVFSKVDVRDYHGQLAQFEGAYRQHGRVDFAIYSAGIREPMGWILSPEIDLHTVKKVPYPAIDLLDINLKGSLYFARIALAYMKEGRDDTAPAEKSITLISSAAAIQDGPGMCSYTASKCGMIGLMRALRALAPVVAGVRVNVISPWATDTAMIASHLHILKDHDVPVNTADDVALYSQYVAVSPEVSGSNIYVGGGKGYDIEAGLLQTRSQWLGQEILDGWQLQDKAFGKGDWLNNGKSN